MESTFIASITVKIVCLSNLNSIVNLQSNTMSTAVRLLCPRCVCQNIVQFDDTLAPQIGGLLVAYKALCILELFVVGPDWSVIYVHIPRRPSGRSYRCYKTTQFKSVSGGDEVDI